jgi:hypothetical protein
MRDSRGPWSFAVKLCAESIYKFLFKIPRYSALHGVMVTIYAAQRRIMGQHYAALRGIMSSAMRAWSLHLGWQKNSKTNAYVFIFKFLSLMIFYFQFELATLIQVQNLFQTATDLRKKWHIWYRYLHRISLNDKT